MSTRPGPLEGRRIAVTGAAGFVGVNVCRWLAERGAEVVGYVRPGGSRWRLAALERSAAVRELDLRDRTRVASELIESGVDAVVHSAARSAYDREGGLTELVADCTGVLANLLAVLPELDCRRFVLLNSSLAYGPNASPHRESDPLLPSTPRGAVRAGDSHLAHAVARLWARGNDSVARTEIVELRLFSVYGPWEPLHRLVPTALRSAIRGEPLALTAPDLRRDFVYVDDVSAAIGAVLTSRHTLAGETFNVGTGEETSNEELVAAVERVVGRSIRIRSDTYPARDSDRPHWCADVSKIVSRLDWRPRITLEDGLVATARWLERHLARDGVET